MLMVYKNVSLVFRRVETFPIEIRDLSILDTKNIINLEIKLAVHSFGPNSKRNHAFSVIS